MKGVVYLISNSINDRKYVGITIRSLKERWNNHRGLVNRSKKPLYLAMKELGRDNFSISILMIIDIDDVEKLQFELDMLEVKYIKEYNAFIKWENGGYNLTTGGGIRNLSTESRKFLGDNLKKTLSDPNIRIRYRDIQIKLNKEHPEKGRIHSKLISGKNHPLFDKSIYSFINIHSGESFIGSRYDLYNKYTELIPSKSHLTDVINGKRNHHKGWKISI